MNEKNNHYKLEMSEFKGQVIERLSAIQLSLVELKMATADNRAAIQELQNWRASVIGWAAGAGAVAGLTIDWIKGKLFQ